MVRQLQVDLLEDAGCIVTEACDGADALSKLAGTSVDLLLTDIRMPQLDGWTLAERARALWPTLPVSGELENYVTLATGSHPQRTDGSIRLRATAFKYGLLPQGGNR